MKGAYAYDIPIWENNGNMYCGAGRYSEFVWFPAERGSLSGFDRGCEKVKMIKDKGLVFAFADRSPFVIKLSGRVCSYAHET